MEILMTILRIAQVAFGIGLVIFVHEGGHFIAARMCGVRVDVFSLGFGPRLFGWKRGETLFQIALIPIGGYVKMAGEEPAGYNAEDLPPKPWELAAKPPLQRFFIYSGGVLMNVVFALVFFPIVFMAGVPSIEPVVGAPVPGSPAWHARIDEGTRIEAINGRDLYDFIYLAGEVALSGNEPSVLRMRRPGATQSELLTIDSEYHEGRSMHWLGLPVGDNPENRLTVTGGGALEAGLTSDDILLGIEGECDLLSPGRQLQMALRRRQSMDVRIERAGQEQVVHVEPLAVAPRGSKLLGIGKAMDTIGGLREGGQELAQLELAEGDRLISVQGRAIHNSGDLLDAFLASADAAETLHIDIERAGKRQILTTELRLDRAGALALYDDIYLNAGEKAWRMHVRKASAAEQSGVRSGDVLLSIDDTIVNTYDRFLPLASAATSVGRDVTLQIARLDIASGQTEELTFKISPERLIPLDYGFDLREGRYIYQTASVGEAISTGAHSAWRFLSDAWISLRKMSSGEVSAKNMGGIITISVISNSWAQQGWSKLFFFLCLLSVNLALLNVLPIPVLDGGHLFFILIEMIKGSPVSERTLGYSQIVGLVMIVTLMVYVTYNDVMRWFF